VTHTHALVQRDRNLCIMAASILCAGAVAFVLSPAAPHVSRASPVVVVPQMSLIDNFRNLFSKRQETAPGEAVKPQVSMSEMMSMVATKGNGPTAADIEEYCRDPDSTGCDLDMIEAMMSEAAKLREKEAQAIAGYNDFQKAFMKPKPERWVDDYGLAI